MRLSCRNHAAAMAKTVGRQYRCKAEADKRGFTTKFISTQETIMRQSSITKTFTIAAVAVVALGLAPAAKGDDKGCSSASLAGTFSRRDTGTILMAPVAAGVGPIAVVGTFTFDGSGNVTGATVSSQNGNIVRGTQTGTYTVNPDCTGTITVQPPGGHAAHYSFVMDDSENGFQYICTDSGPISIVYTGTARRQFPLTDWRR